MQKTLKKRDSKLAKAQYQVDLLSKKINGVDSFGSHVQKSGVKVLKPSQLEILQINLGYMCNLTCEHCHVDAGPDRKEIMTKDTLLSCLSVIQKTRVNTVDLTGGAPEMHPDFLWFIEELSKLNVKTIVRSNLTILVSNEKYKKYPVLFKKFNVVVIASLPCYTKENTDKQRGDGTFSKSIEALKVLNDLGYGKLNTGLELDLVFNPGGPGLPPDQSKLELDYKKELWDTFEIEFNSLYTITNLPISRFLDYLLAAKKYEEYMLKLSNAFNPASLSGIMCKNTLSVDWKGNLYDCDFNQMLELPVQSPVINISEFNEDLLAERSIVINNHCLGCTAGSGSSCQGALVE